MKLIGSHAAFSMGVYFDGGDFNLGEPRVQLVSNRAGFQDAAFGANIGLSKGYFYEECSYRVKQFCSKFLVPFFRYLFESRNINFSDGFRSRLLS